MKTALLLLISALGIFAQPPVINGRIETRAFTGALDTQLRGAGPAWFGYEIKTMRRSDDSCNGHNSQPIHLEGSDRAAIYFRVANNQVEKIHVYSLNCEIDADGLPLVWFTGVSSQASLAYLQKQVGGSLANSAIFAISRHDDPQAIDLLIRDAKSEPSTHTREQALFWLAQRAGTRASAAIVDAIVNDPDTQVKKRAVFALSQLPKDDGVPKLIEVAQTQRNPEVRKQAFFWLGQSHDPRALAFIESVLTK
jgi:HEAT repeat protein